MLDIPIWVWVLVAIWLFFGYLGSAIAKYWFITAGLSWNRCNVLLSVSMAIFGGMANLIATSSLCWNTHKKIGLRWDIFSTTE